jgi:hypothetical protein
VKIIFISGGPGTSFPEALIFYPCKFESTILFLPLGLYIVEAIIEDESFVFLTMPNFVELKTGDFVFGEAFLVGKTGGVASLGVLSYLLGFEGKLL